MEMSHRRRWGFIVLVNMYWAEGKHNGWARLCDGFIKDSLKYAVKYIVDDLSYNDFIFNLQHFLYIYV